MPEDAWMYLGKYCKFAFGVKQKKMRIIIIQSNIEIS